MQALPIDPHLPKLVASLRAQPNLVLVAEPGAGKTTRLPRALLDAGFGDDGEIVVLEPRRIAARMAARRVADELGEPVGRRIGYQVRLEEQVSAQTRVRFVTEGILTRKLIADPELRGVGTVLLDEFHERHLQGDLALALLRRLQRTRRPALRLCAMSATLDAAPLASFLECEVIDVPGRRFEVAIEYAEKASERALEREVAAAVRALVRDGLDGDVLVFLPGAGEIRRAREALEPLAREHSLRIALLHGDLPAAEQDQALARGKERKLILSTNIAESSLTIDGVCAVIDSGLARVAGHSPWSGLPTLATAKISRASAAQRAGRAGRQRAGRCLRLYTRHDHDTRPLHDKPEIARAELCETWLAVQAVDRELTASDWFEPPPREAWDAAHELARLLGAVDAHGLSARGRRLLRFPLHPRLAAIALEAEARGAAERGCALAALLAERDIALEARARFGERKHDIEAGPSDALDRLERFEAAEASRFDPHELRRLGLDAHATRSAARTRDRLLRACERDAMQHNDGDDAILCAVLAGFGDRVAKRRAPRSQELVLARGGSLTQAQESVVRDAELCVIIDASEQPGRPALARAVSAIEPEWLLELFPNAVVDHEELRFEPQSERVEAVHELRYHGLVLDESRTRDASGPDVQRVLYEAALTRGIDSFDDKDELERFERRARHAGTLDPNLPALDADARSQALAAACEGLHSFSELRATGILPALRGLFSSEQLARIERLAPTNVMLGKRNLPVHYEPDRPPWVQSRLQDFFGLRTGPKLGDQPLVLHLLAPNQRAVQVTTDLAGFWQRHYPDLRRQLMRRYPKHAWPEDPLSARPPEPRR